MKEVDYHDYVIKDGKLIGKFEEMYRDCKDPWLQTQKQDREEIKIMLKMIEGRNYQYILELGCGYGHIANKLTKFGSVVGVDISLTAIKKARLLYPNIKFYTCDVIKGLDFMEYTKELNYEKNFDLIVFSGTLWYVIEHIDKIFEDIRKHCNPNGEFLLNLPFPPLNENFYGKNIIPNEISLINNVSKYFDVIKKSVIEGEKPNSPIVIIYSKKKRIRMSCVVYVSGKFVPETEAKISIYDSALMFGDMVFELTHSFNKKQFKVANDEVDRYGKSLAGIAQALKRIPMHLLWRTPTLSSN